MAIKLIGFMNKVINDTTSKILDDQLIDKITNVVATFFKSGVESLRDATNEEPPETEDP